jgi:tetratricopeptide (TPR) repeat protein
VIAAAGVLIAAALLQAADAQRARAIQLARAGQPAEAIRLFEEIVARDPGDVDARLWVARLELRLGHVEKAEAGFRDVLAAHPKDVDAHIGLGGVLTRKGAWQEALDMLHAAEADAGANGDLFAAIARASRRGGDDRAALEYYTRALAVSREDPDVVDGYENVARTYGHWIAVDGYHQQVTPGDGIGGSSVQGDVRASPRVHLQGGFRAQKSEAYSDAIGGGGFLWRAGRATNVSFHAAGGSGNEALPNADLGGYALHYAGIFEMGVAARRLSFDGVSVAALSPLLSLDGGGRWRLDGRYTYSRSHFTQSGTARGDNSGSIRATLRGWRRVWINGSYAYGIESFENLTADRVDQLGAHTLAGGARVNLHTLTVLNATWEHQWRSNDSRLDRVTVSVAQFFP